MLRAAQLDEGTQDYGGDSFTYASRRTLEYQLEYALVFGTGSAGNALIRELAVWHREWREWRDTIMPKFIEAFPGRRPAAASMVAMRRCSRCRWRCLATTTTR